ncbi:MAG: peptide deformylase [Deltaproteobacteria bacterium]|nr:peptide deformylase [Deltaproteobacteria bacterium]
MVREIVIWPDPRLREEARRVEVVDDSVRALIADLFETMYAANGVGLAAPQVAVAKRVITIDTSPKQEGVKPLALVNPVIVKTEGETVYQEGCLSIPGEAEDVTRAAKVWVKALDKDGKEFEVEATDLLAIALQHEIDHLDGKVFVDHVSALKRGLIKRRMQRLKADREQEKAEGKPSQPQRQGTPGL